MKKASFSHSHNHDLHVLLSNRFILHSNFLVFGVEQVKPGHGHAVLISKFQWFEYIKYKVNAAI